MFTQVTLTTIFNCSLERAFKAPILCDVSKVHTGFGIMPAVTHTTGDENWGQPGYSKKVFAAKSWTQAGGWAASDKILERVENKYWLFEISNFQAWMLGFTKFIAEWHTTELEPNKILITYTYKQHADTYLFYPLNWLFTNVFWRMYLKRVLENVRKLAEGNEPFQYK